MVIFHSYVKLPEGISNFPFNGSEIASASLEVSKSNRSLKVRCFVSWLIWRISPDELGSVAKPSRDWGYYQFESLPPRGHKLPYPWGFSIRGTGNRGPGDTIFLDNYEYFCTSHENLFFESLARTCRVLNYRTWGGHEDTGQRGRGFGDTGHGDRWEWDMGTSGGTGQHEFKMHTNNLTMRAGIWFAVSFLEMSTISHHPKNMQIYQVHKRERRHRQIRQVHKRENIYLLCFLQIPHWLVVPTPLKNMKVSWGYYSQDMEK